MTWELHWEEDAGFWSIDDTVSVGLLIFSDGVLCISSLPEDSSGSGDSELSATVSGSTPDLDLDDIPF